MAERDVNGSEKLSPPRVGGSFRVETGNKDREQTAAVPIRREQNNDSGKAEYREDNFQTSAATKLPCDKEKDYEHADEGAARIRKHNGRDHYRGTCAVEKFSRSSFRA